MNGQPRHAAAELKSSDVPETVGVYAWYHDGEPIYAGRAIGVEGLHGRVWKDHLAKGPDLSRSSFRRNVCDHLGIADTTVTKSRPTRLTADDVEPVNRWILGCEVAWIEFVTVKEARDFEKRLLVEWMPPLSRR
jgi:hypothetical protein